MSTEQYWRLVLEDELFLVVEKPAGMHTAPLAAGESSNLLSSLIAAYPEVGRLPGRKPIEPGLLHRLDRETSGLVVVARTQAGFAGLQEQFVAGRVQKLYAALCVLKPADQGQAPEGKSEAEWQALLEGPGGSPPLSFRSRFRPSGPRRSRVAVVPVSLPEDRPAGEGAPRVHKSRLPREATARIYESRLRIVARRPDPLPGQKGLFLVQVSLYRGFRHQVRAHLACLGLPILGDLLYNPPLPAAGLHLHAYGLELAHPLTGAPLSIRTPLPPAFLALFPEAAC